jgi:hypothetical protein
MRETLVAERSEKQKMLAGELYNSTGPELVGERHAAQRLLARYNATDVGDAAGRLTGRVGCRIRRSRSPS